MSAASKAGQREGVILEREANDSVALLALLASLRESDVLSWLTSWGANSTKYVHCSVLTHTLLMLYLMRRGKKDAEARTRQNMYTTLCKRFIALGKFSFSSLFRRELDKICTLLLALSIQALLRLYQGSLKALLRWGSIKVVWKVAWRSHTLVASSGRPHALVACSLRCVRVLESAGIPRHADQLQTRRSINALLRLHKDLLRLWWGAIKAVWRYFFVSLRSVRVLQCRNTKTCRPTSNKSTRTASADNSRSELNHTRVLN